MQFWSHWSWPLATAIIGTVFTALLARQYVARRGPHQLAWAIGFLIYAAAAFMEAYSEYAGSWNHTVYRIYIVMAASLVGFLGLGVLFLVLRKPLWGRVFLAYLLAATAVFLAGTFPRIMSLFLNIPGTVFLLGGALYSIIRPYPAEMVGAALLLWGFLKASTLEKAAGTSGASGSRS